MVTRSEYFPQGMFAGKDEDVPRVMIAPQRYIQGNGVIDHVGRYLSLLNAQRAGILISTRGQQSDGIRVIDSLKQRNVDAVVSTFRGECSLDEINHHADALKDEKLDCLIAMGGGKCVDAGKCIAYRLNVPVVVVPTLASNDAPCSALSVLYSPEGIMNGVEYFPDNPAMVIVDTGVVASASERYLVSGMGDAMATWYEARACLSNPAARTPIGARPTLASCAMGEICAHTLYESGEEAAAAVSVGRIDDAVEKVVEANTLLSGLGFESGGLAVAHAIAGSYTQIKVVHDNYLHGEMVAMGTMVQLAIEKSDDAIRAAEFFARVGLPIHLGQVSMGLDDKEDIDTLVDATMAAPITHNMPMEVTKDVLRTAFYDAHELGQRVAGDIGDAAYRKLQDG